MIEVIETSCYDGTKATVSGLKTATVRIYPEDCGSWYTVKTSRRSNGSIRYNSFPTYPAALDYALAYANRIAKQKAEKIAQLQGVAQTPGRALLFG